MQHGDHLVRIEIAAAQVTIMLGEEQQRAAPLLGVDVDAGLAQSVAELVRRVLADDVEASFAATQTAADVLDGRGQLLVAIRVKRADVIALTVLHAWGVAHAVRLLHAVGQKSTLTAVYPKHRRRINMLLETAIALARAILADREQRERAAADEQLANTIIAHVSAAIDRAKGEILDFLRQQRLDDIAGRVDGLFDTFQRYAADP